MVRLPTSGVAGITTTGVVDVGGISRDVIATAGGAGVVCVGMEALGVDGIGMDVVGGGDVRPGLVEVLKRAINLEKTGVAVGADGVVDPNNLSRV